MLYITQPGCWSDMGWIPQSESESLSSSPSTVTNQHMMCDKVLAVVSLSLLNWEWMLLLPSLAGLKEIMMQTHSVG